MIHKVRFVFIAALVAVMGSIVTAQNVGDYGSAASGNWSALGSWVVCQTNGDWGDAIPAVSLPIATDKVYILDGHTITIDQNVSIEQLTVGGGTSGILTFDATTNREMIISGNLTVSTGGSFIVFPALTPTGNVTNLSNIVTSVSSTTGISTLWNISGPGIPSTVPTTVSAFDASTITMSVAATLDSTGALLSIKPTLKDSIYIGGNLINNGKFDMSLGSSTTVCNVIFNKTSGNQTISGTGDTTRFRGVTLAKSSKANKVICSINVMMASTNITFTAGTWEQTAGRLTTTSGSMSVGVASGTVAAFNIIGSGSAKIANNLNIFGDFLFNTSDSLIVGSGGSKIDLTGSLTGVATFTSGTVLIYGKFATAALNTTTINGANFIINPIGFTANDYAFRSTTGTGGTHAFVFTSGTVTILNPSGFIGANPELAMSSSVAPNISGTALFVLGQGEGTLPGGQGFRVNLSNVNVINHLTINTGSVNVVLQAHCTVNGTLTLTSGKLALTTFRMIIGTAGTISGGSSTAYIDASSTGVLRKLVASTGSFIFPVGDAVNYSPATISVTAGTFLPDTLSVRVTPFKHPSNTSVTDSLKRYWTVTNSAMTYDPTFNYVVGDVAGTESNLVGGSYNGSTWTFMGGVNTGTHSFSSTGFSASSLSFTAGETSVMPVELISFTAMQKGRSIELAWKTATEVNNMGFEIEKNITGSWNKIGYVEGAGTSNAPNTYSFVDANAKGTLLYRLKQIDRDGKFSYSSTVEVNVVAAPTVLALNGNYPNPFNPTTNISFTVPFEGRAVVKVFDILGKEIATVFNDVAVSGEQYSVPFVASSLPSGIYFSQLQFGGQKLVKKMMLMK